MAIYQLGEDAPEIDPSAYVAETASLIGKVTIAAGATVWFGATLRGDNERITIGAGSNVQEGTVMHTDPGHPLDVGANVTIGHQAMLHGCTIGDGTLIGINSVVLNGAKIGKGVLVGANTLITEGKEIPDGVLVLGSPGKVVRELKPDEQEKLLGIATGYIARSHMYREELRPTPQSRARRAGSFT
jgi:carbonic anhydrase/acetyltransferase-like protein (isoleucine patch superfamily)